MQPLQPQHGRIGSDAALEEDVVARADVGAVEQLAHLQRDDRGDWRKRLN